MHKSELSHCFHISQGWKPLGSTLERFSIVRSLKEPTADYRASRNSDTTQLKLDGDRVRLT
uniref:Uncharacterized protein n=1 Tax=Arundo donax TaxID=35708 RepID=A0A0A9AAX3_ARUDO